ncbi:MAG: hypothetical protein ACRD0J_11335 [Acidimicrobiales bacterium]
MVRRWLSWRSILLHAAVAVAAPGCLYAGWWQVTVAMAGDPLGWLYAVEWPVFSVFAVIVWWNLLHDDPASVGDKGLRRLVSLGLTPASAGGPAGAGAPGTLPTGDPGPITVTAPAYHAENEPAGRARRRDEEDPKLAAYNDYLAALAKRGRPKTLLGR